MLSVAEEYLREHNPSTSLEVFGQELNDETYAICRSGMMLKGDDPSHILSGTPSTRTATRVAPSTTCSPIRSSGSSGRKLA